MIVQSPKVPDRIRKSLDVEAGLNDGLSVPFLLCFIAVSQLGTQGAGQVLLTTFMSSWGWGRWSGCSSVLRAAGCWDWPVAASGWTASVQQLGLVSIPVLSMLACEPVGGSMFIAAYVAGLAIQPGFKDAGTHSLEFTEGWGQLFDYFIFFLFGLLAAMAFASFRPAPPALCRPQPDGGPHAPRGHCHDRDPAECATVLFMGWFGPRGLASIVLGLVFLEHEAHLPGEETIKLTVMVTVLLSIFAHGFSALPGINLYARKVAALPADAPENRA